MKKIIISLLAIFLVAGCSSGKSYKDITYNDFAKKVKDKDNFVVFLGSAQCSYCDDFKPTLIKVIQEYDLDVSYIDVSKVSETQYNEIKNKVDLQGTPTVAYIEDGKCNTEENLIGNTSYEDTVEYFKSIGYIK